MRKLLISAAMLMMLCLIAWVQRIHILQVFLDMRFDFQLEVAALEITPGSITGVRASGFSLKSPQFQAQAEEAYVEFKLSELGGDGYYLAWAETRNGKVEIIIKGTTNDVQEPGSGNPESEDQKDAGSEAQRHFVRWIPESFKMIDTQLHYLDDDQDIEFVAEKCVANRRSDTSEIDLDCRGTLQNDPLVIHGRYGLPDPSGNAEPLDLQVNWGQYNLTAEGRLDALSRLTGADLSLALTAPSSAPLLDLLGASEVRDGVVDLNGNLKHIESRFIIQVAGELSGIALSLDGSFASLRDISPLQASFNIAGPSLYEAGALFNEFRLQAQPFSTTGQIAYSNKHLTLTDIRIGVEQGFMLGSLDMPNFPDTVGMEVDLSAENFKPNLLKPVAELCQLPQEQVDVDAKVVVTDQGQIVSINLDGPSFDVNAHGKLNESPGSGRLNISIAGTSLQTLGYCIAVELPDTPAELSTQLHYEGNELNFSNIELTSQLADIGGIFALELSESLSFSTHLNIDVPDALELVSKMADYQGPIERFPFKGNLSMAGNSGSVDITALNFRSADHEGIVKGTLGNPQTFEGLNLLLEMQGDNLRHLLSDPERSGNQVQPYRLSTRIANHPEGWLIEGLDLQVANSRVILDGRLTRLPLYLGSHLELQASGENIQTLFGPWVDHPLPALPFTLLTSIDFSEDFFRFENLNVTVGEHTLRADMSVDRPPDYSKTYGHLTFSGPSTLELTDLIGLEYEILDRPYEVSFNVTGDLNKLMVTDLQSRIAETDVSGQILFQNKTPYHMDVDLVSESFYLPLIDPSLAGEGQKPKDTDAGDGRVFSNTTFPVGWMRALDGEFTWDIKKTWTTEDYQAQILLDMELADGRLVGRNIHWESNDSDGDLEFQMVESNGNLDLSLAIESSRIPLFWLLAGESLPSENKNFRALLDSKGNSLRTIMGNLNGTLLWEGGSGRIQSSRLEFLFGDFLTSAARVIVGRQSAEERRTTTISCTAGGMHFVDGVAHLSPGIVSRTDRTDFYATGSIDLAREKLKLVFLTKSRTGIGLSPLKVVAPRLKVGGTMSEPRFSVDTTSTALSTSAAFFSGGMSVLATGIWDRMSSNSDVCAQLPQQARKMKEFSTHQQ